MLAGLAAIWFTFAPLKLGGKVSYVLVNGLSMEPNYHTGDLIIVRRAVDYKVGEVVTYHDALMAVNVIHRIISVESGRYSLKGDNNSWVDEYQPSREEILGKLWIYIPKAASAALWIRKPLNLALAAALLGGVFMMDVTNEHSSQKRKKNYPSQSTSFFETGLYIAVVIGLCFLAMGLFAFIKPLTRPAEKIPYQQIGTFSYTATGSSTVYGSGAVHSGEPIFTRLTCLLKTNFTYALEASGLEDVTGQQQLDATIQDEQTGWQRTFPISEPASFDGITFKNQASINLCGMENLVHSVEKAVGIHSNSYSLTIAAHVVVSGKLKSLPFSESFDPQMVFHFDNLRFSLTSGTDALQTVEKGGLDNPIPSANTLKIFSLQPTISDLRGISVEGLLVSVMGMLILGTARALASHRSQETAIRMKYGSLLMDAKETALTLESQAQIVDVASIENLARLAERQNTLITHVSRSTEHIYMLQSGGTVYRYGTNSIRHAPGHKPHEDDPLPETNRGDLKMKSQVSEAATATQQITRELVHVNRKTDTFQVEPLDGRTPGSDAVFHISDEFWSFIKPLLPKQKVTHPFGCRWLDVPDRTCADAIFYVLKTGCQWEELDRLDYCPSATAYERFLEWSAANVFIRSWKYGGSRFEEMNAAKGFAPYKNNDRSQGS